jgi:PAS domain S-box-containing protein
MMPPDQPEIETLAEAMPEIVWIVAPDGAATFLNHRWTEYTGLSREESLGWGWIRAVYPEDAADTARAWRSGLRSEESFDLEYRLRDQMGNLRWFLARAVPQRDRTGRVVRWIGNSFDIDRHRRAMESLRLLADTGSALGASLDLQSMLDMLLPVLVPRICDWAVIALASSNALRVAAILHRDPQKDAVAQTLVGKVYPARPDSSLSPTYAAFHFGTPQIWNAMRDLPLERIIRPEMHDTLRLLGQRSSIVVPLRDGEQVIGTLGAVRTDIDRPFGERDLPLLQEIADRASLAIGRARIFERERLIADTLQLASLPTTLPSVSGYAFDAYYAPARNESKIGGDWYDVFNSGDDRLALTVGDVSGSGLGAAVAMGKIRNTIRALAYQETDPAEVLRAADALIVRENPELLATAMVGFLDARSGRLSFSTAGHPAPVMRVADGQVQELPADGLPLGLLSREHPPLSATVQLSQGSLIVFYTDGLIEETRDVLAGERALHEALADERIVHEAHPARYLYERILPDGSHDDVAILTLYVRHEHRGSRRAQPPAWEAHWRFEVLHFGAPAGARESFVRFLQSRGAPDADYFAAEVIFGELLGNVVRHASAPVEVELDWTSDYPVLHVQDRGPGFEWNAATMPDPLSDGGRGLALVATGSSR